jgi:hypothetical protein
MEFTVVSKDGENARNGVTGCVHLDYNLTAGEEEKGGPVVD